MPNPSDTKGLLDKLDETIAGMGAVKDTYIVNQGCPDIMGASDADLKAMSTSKDKLLWCAARDEIKRRKLEADKAAPGPASPELCKALGIDANDLKDALPEKPVTRKARNPWSETEALGRGGSATVVRHVPDPQDAMLKRAADSLAGESVKTKEAVVTTVATYLANKADNWWMQPQSFREKEMFFVIKMLVHTYSSLEEI
jgi:hypothetical protein